MDLIILGVNLIELLDRFLQEFFLRLSAALWYSLLLLLVADETHLSGVLDITFRVIGRCVLRVGPHLVEIDFLHLNHVNSDIYTLFSF